MMMKRGEQRASEKETETNGGGGVWVVSRNRLAKKSRRTATLRCLEAGSGILDSRGERREE